MKTRSQRLYSHDLQECDIMMNPHGKRKRFEFGKRMMMNLYMKRKITMHNSRYLFEPSYLETPNKYEY
jgi:hypothetical protein